MQWNEYMALAILAVWMLTVGAGAHKHGTVTVEPVRARSFNDILQELLTPMHNQESGKIIMLDGMTLSLQRKDGTIIIVEFLTAARSPDFPPIGTGKYITAIGKSDAQGILHAKVIFRSEGAIQ